MKLHHILFAQPSPLVRIGVWLASIIAIGLLGYLRLHSNPAYEFHLFFLLPILAVAWFINLPRASILVVLTVILWYLSERQLAGDDLVRAPLLFNTALRAMLFLAAAWLVNRLRSTVMSTNNGNK